MINFRRSDFGHSVSELFENLTLPKISRCTVVLIRYSSFFKSISFYPDQKSSQMFSLQMNEPSNVAQKTLRASEFIGGECHELC